MAISLLRDVETRPEADRGMMGSAVAVSDN